jgi:hypothetical protein
VLCFSSVYWGVKLHPVSSVVILFCLLRCEITPSPQCSDTLLFTEVWNNTQSPVLSDKCYRWVSLLFWFIVLIWIRNSPCIQLWQYKWNIVESGIKHHNPNPNTYLWLMYTGQFLVTVMYTGQFQWFLFSNCVACNFLFHDLQILSDPWK